MHASHARFVTQVLKALTLSSKVLEEVERINNLEEEEARESDGGRGEVLRERARRKYFITPRYFTNLSLMTNTATFNTSNNNTNDCSKLKYTLKTKQNKNIIV